MKLITNSAKALPFSLCPLLMHYCPDIAVCVLDADRGDPFVVIVLFHANILKYKKEIIHVLL